MYKFIHLFLLNYMSTNQSLYLVKFHQIWVNTLFLKCITETLHHEIACLKISMLYFLTVRLNVFTKDFREIRTSRIRFAGIASSPNKIPKRCINLNRGQETGSSVGIFGWRARKVHVQAEIHVKIDNMIKTLSQKINQSIFYILRISNFNNY